MYNQPVESNERFMRVFKKLNSSVEPVNHSPSPISKPKKSNNTSFIARQSIQSSDNSTKHTSNIKPKETTFNEAVSFLL